jgi:hypothetical protein
LMPKPHEYAPTIGEEVLVTNHLGSFMVEEIDAEAKTASLRVLRSGVLMKNVTWSTIWPLSNEIRDLLREIAAGGEVNSEILRKFLSGRK